MKEGKRKGHRVKEGNRKEARRLKVRCKQEEKIQR